MMKYTFPVFNEYEDKKKKGYIYVSPDEEYSSSYYLADMYPP